MIFVVTTFNSPTLCIFFMYLHVLEKTTDGAKNVLAKLLQKYFMCLHFSRGLYGYILQTDYWC